MPPTKPHDENNAARVDYPCKHEHISEIVGCDSRVVSEVGDTADDESDYVELEKPKGLQQIASER